jgi:hypothetical protein
MTEQFIVTMMDNNISNIFPTKLLFDNETNTLNKTNETNTLNKTNTNLYYGIKWLTGC